MSDFSLSDENADPNLIPAFDIKTFMFGIIYVSLGFFWVKFTKDSIIRRDHSLLSFCFSLVCSSLAPILMMYPLEIAAEKYKLFESEDFESARTYIIKSTFVDSFVAGIASGVVVCTGFVCCKPLLNNLSQSLNAKTKI